MLIMKFLLSDIAGGTANAVDFAERNNIDGNSDSGLASDSTHLYNAQNPGDNYGSDHLINGLTKSTMDLILSAIPSRGPRIGLSSDLFLPDTFFRPSYMAYVPSPAPPVAAVQNTFGQVIW